MVRITTAVAALSAAVACSAPASAAEPEGLAQPERVAEITQIVTGVAVTPDGRVLVNTPRWFEGFRPGVYEVMPGGGLSPYPDRVANSWAPRSSPLTQLWVCVQSVHTGPLGDVWVLDPAAPGMQGPEPGAPKLVRIDPDTNARVEMFNFTPDVAPEGSYLNDVRLDRGPNGIGGYAFITDSGLGALIVLDLATGRARRVLDDHPSTSASPDFVPVIGGAELRSAWTGEVPQIHSDGIAIDTASAEPGDGYVYWQALTAKTLYRAPIAALTAGEIGQPFDETELRASIEDLGETVVTDGMARDRAGNIYFSALEHDAVMYHTPTGEIKTLATGNMISWPDSFQVHYENASQDSDRPGWLYFTTARIHETSWFSENESMPEPYDDGSAPYAVWRVKLPE